MQRFTYHYYPGAKVYFTLADPSAQQFYSVGGRDLSAMLNLSLLLSDHIILSTGHMLRSMPTYSWLRRNQAAVAELASKKALLVSISEKYASCGDLAKDQTSDAIPPWNPDNERFPGVHDRAKLLDDLFPFGITWRSADQSIRFRQLLLTHLEDSQSPLRRNLVAFPSKAVGAVVKQLSGVEDFTRGTLLNATSGLQARHRRTIMRYGDCYYYLSGALFKDAFPLMHARAASLLREQVLYARKRAASPPLPEEMWRAFMDEWGVLPDMLADLSLLTVLELRRESVGRAVRSTYRRLLVSARQGVATASAIFDFAEAQKRLLALLTSELVAQQRKHTKWESRQRWLSNASWVTSGIGTMVGYALTEDPVYGAAIGLLSFMAGVPLGKLESKLGNTELVLLANEIKRRTQ